MYIYRIASEIFKAFHLNSFSRDLNISFLFSLLFESGKERVKIKKRKVKKKRKKLRNTSVQYLLKDYISLYSFLDIL